MSTVQSRTETRWWKPIAALLVSVVVVLTLAGPATAGAGDVSTTTTTHTSASAAASQHGTACAATEVDTSGSLPVTRWAEGTEFHDRLHAMQPGDIVKNLQRQGIVSSMFGVGNMAWSLTTGASEMAINFCLLDKVGGTVDNVAAKIGSAMMGSGIVALLVVASVVVFLWRVGRSQGGGANTAELLKKAVVLGMIAVMIGGAGLSKGGGAEKSPGATYQPGPGSPGWFITQIDKVVASSASLLANGLQEQSIAGAETGPAGRGGMGCSVYVDSMKDLYKKQFGKNYATNAGATVPVLLSSMWETTGLEMWKQAQFGQQNIGTYKYKQGGVTYERPYGFGDLMYCRMLDLNVAAKRHPTGKEGDNSVSAIMANARYKGDKVLDRSFHGLTPRDSGKSKERPWHTDGYNLAWRYSANNKVKDRFFVGWAACTAPSVAGPKNDPGARLVHARDGHASDTDLRDNCQKFFYDVHQSGEETYWDGGGNSLGLGAFDWDEADDDISQTGTSAEAEDFLLTLHGSRQSGGIVSGLVYMTSSIVVACVFILFAIAIMIAKIAAMMMMLGIMFVLVITLAPNTSMSKVTDFAKQYLGLSLFAWGAQLLMSLLAVITALLIDVGNQVVPGGPGGLMALAWVGFAPAIALFCMHFIFKKLKIPSPVSMTGGMAWGKMAAAGAVGGAAVAGTSMVGSRMANRAKSGVMSKGKQVTSKISGKDRRGQMTPDGPNKSSNIAASGRPTAGGRAEKDESIDPIAAMSPADRNAVIKKAQQEKKDAKQWAKSPEGQDALGTRSERIKAAAKQRRDAALQGANLKLGAAVDKTTSAMAQLKDRPFEILKSGAGATARGAATGARKGAKAAAIGTGVVVAGAATGGLGLVGAGVAYGAYRGIKGRQDRRAALLRDEGASSQVEAFRAHRAREQEATAQAEQESLARAYEYGQSRQPQPAKPRQIRPRSEGARTRKVSPKGTSNGHTREKPKGGKKVAGRPGPA